MNEKIRVQFGGVSETASNAPSYLSKLSSKRVKFGTIEPKSYKQREGDYAIVEEDDIPDLLDADYPSLVETSDVKDATIGSFEVYDQIYKAWNLYQEKDV